MKPVRGSQREHYSKIVKTLFPTFPNHFMALEKKICVSQQSLICSDSLAEKFREWNLYELLLAFRNCQLAFKRSRHGTVVRALASHQCDSASFVG